MDGIAYVNEYKRNEEKLNEHVCVRVYMCARMYICACMYMYVYILAKCRISSQYCKLTLV